MTTNPTTLEPPKTTSAGIPLEIKCLPLDNQRCQNNVNTGFIIFYLVLFISTWVYALFKPLTVGWFHAYTITEAIACILLWLFWTKTCLPMYSGDDGLIKVEEDYSTKNDETNPNDKVDHQILSLKQAIRTAQKTELEILSVTIGERSLNNIATSTIEEQECFIIEYLNYEAICEYIVPVNIFNTAVQFESPKNHPLCTQNFPTCLFGLTAKKLEDNYLIQNMLNGVICFTEAIYIPTEDDNYELCLGYSCRIIDK